MSLLPVQNTFQTAFDSYLVATSFLHLQTVVGGKIGEKRNLVDVRGGETVGYI